jgi:hypothetical protein
MASLVILVLLKKPVFHLILKSATVTGTIELCTIPSPKAPFKPYPQHLAVPSERTAQVCQPPAVIAVAVLIPLTATGTEESSVNPLPNSP